MLPRQEPLGSPDTSSPQEVTLTSTRAERDLQDSLAELFSIIVTLDELEKAFIKDAVSEAEYTEICERSLRQYNALLADETIAREFGGLEEFQAKWDIEAPRATKRLQAGMPSTITTPSSSAAVGGGGGGGGGGASDRGGNTSGVLILEATQDFITFLDAVKLGLLSKDQLHPLLSDVIQSVNKVTDKDFENRGKIVQWLITLNQMKASEELSEQQARELDMDIQQAYQGFRRTLT
ncbi:vacuolar protein sorting-associated protein Vps28 [Cordyceps fumosorosea ARSEF 2679]|uniref:Vacuolar protein sorting-associated protein 28 n=1 Tax=Cordyceps fumosorosea (strain ARSEF 2679) TaxID=1081104 RepID=A0A167V3F4_CORFA|nr:vacuolar protein sorting-associated protein Vps28 [Cordyceps fumosorosea ARSEF 2679]OAA62193.1 vacuolar protein sorting-associated protein Vps28 [Cordyceps fumosorosea ARSEF 2679]